ncbi:MAG: hypothetical protein ACLTK8_02660 [Paeniclostridium sp.]
MVYMNVVQHEYYTSLAENKTYKEVTIKFVEVKSEIDMVDF